MNIFICVVYTLITFYQPFTLLQRLAVSFYLNHRLSATWIFSVLLSPLIRGLKPCPMVLKPVSKNKCCIQSLSSCSRLYMMFEWQNIDPHMGSKQVWRYCLILQSQIVQILYMYGPPALISITISQKPN